MSRVLAPIASTHSDIPSDRFVSESVRDPSRVAAVRRLVPGRRSPGPAFDRLTRLAARLLQAPMVAVTLVDCDRLLLVSSYGLGDISRQVPLEESICQYAVAAGAPLVVEDVSTDPRLSRHSSAAGLSIVSYAGAPLVTPDGYAVGTICVMDSIPRSWTDDQLANLTTLASICMDELRLSGFERSEWFNREWAGVAEAAHQIRRG
jgi:GAF domain-containing protein